MTNRRNILQGLASLILLILTGAVIRIVIFLPDDPTEFWLEVLAFTFGGIAVLIIIVSLWAFSWAIVGSLIKRFTE